MEFEGFDRLSETNVGFAYPNSEVDRNYMHTILLYGISMGTFLLVRIYLQLMYTKREILASKNRLIIMVFLGCVLSEVVYDDIHLLKCWTSMHQ